MDHFVDEAEVALVRAAELEGVVVHRYTVSFGHHVGTISWRWKVNWRVMKEEERKTISNLTCMLEMLTNEHPDDFRLREWRRMLEIAEEVEQSSDISPTAEIAHNPIGSWVHEQRDSPFPDYLEYHDMQRFNSLRTVSHHLHRSWNILSNLQPSFSLIMNPHAVANPLRWRPVKHWGIDLGHLKDTLPDAKGTECTICRENRPRIVLVKCGHCVLCFKCTQKLFYEQGDYQRPLKSVRCPICNANVECYVQLFT